MGRPPLRKAVLARGDRLTGDSLAVPFTNAVNVRLGMMRGARFALLEAL
jgi:hypothetical protein